MKKFTIGLFMFLALVIATPQTHASTVSKLRAQIVSLKQEIASLQSLLSASAVASVSGNTNVQGAGTSAGASPCTPTSVPSVTVTSPNGGEVYQVGQQITVTWTSCNISATDPIILGLGWPTSWNIAFGLTSLTTTNTGSALFTLPVNSNFSASNGFQYGKYYTIYIKAPSTIANTASSNANFSILATTAPAFSILTIAPTTITATSATLNGSSSLGGGLSKRFFQYSSSATGPWSSNIAARNSGSTFYFPLTGLTQNTTYYFRAGAIVNGNTLYGQTLNFTTSSTPSQIITSYVGNTFTPSKNTLGILTSETYTTTVTVKAIGHDFFINPVANFVPNTTLSIAQNGVANTAYGFNVAVLNASNQFVTPAQVTKPSVALSTTCTAGCIQQSLSSMKIPAGTTATFVISTTLTDSASIVAGGYKIAIFSTNATDGTTLSSFPSTPIYSFITPVSPDSFQ